MRFSANAIPCLLFCVAAVTLAPNSAWAHARAASALPAFHSAGSASHAQHASRFDANHQFARHRTRKPQATPKVAASAPRDGNNRFLMTQNGKQMTADDFEAWMKSRGIRVAKGTPAKSAD